MTVSQRVSVTRTLAVFLNCSSYGTSSSTPGVSKQHHQGKGLPCPPLPALACPSSSVQPSSALHVPPCLYSTLVSMMKRCRHSPLSWCKARWSPICPSLYAHARHHWHVPPGSPWPNPRDSVVLCGGVGASGQNSFCCPKRVISISWLP